MTELPNVYTDKTGGERSDRVVTRVPQRLLTTAVVVEIVALLLFVVGNRWILTGIHRVLPWAWLMLAAHLMRGFAESVLLGALAEGFYRKDNDHDYVLEGAAILTVVYHLTMATCYFTGFPYDLSEVALVLSYLTVFFCGVTGAILAIVERKKLRLAGILFIGATLTAIPLAFNLWVGFVWWVLNKLLTVAFVIVLRQRLVSMPASGNETAQIAATEVAVPTESPAAEL